VPRVGHHDLDQIVVVAGDEMGLYHKQQPVITQANLKLASLCVPKIRFGVDAASGRRKLAS
jgi:hypothetical protein